MRVNHVVGPLSLALLLTGGGIARLGATAGFHHGLLAQDSLRPHVEAWTAANQRAIVGEFLDLLSIPNVAADRASIERNAAFLKGMLEKRGFKAELLSTKAIRWCGASVS